jgi:hypothetical protein
MRLVLIDKAINSLVSFLVWKLAKDKKILLSFGLGTKFALVFRLKAWKCWHSLSSFFVEKQKKKEREC